MPVRAYMYDEWGNPLSSEPQYFASGGAALQAQAQRDAQIHDQKQRQYSFDPVTGQMRGPTPLSRGDMAAASDAQDQYWNGQQNSMYQALMGMFGGNNGISSALGGWTPGSTMVGGGGGFGGGGFGGGALSGGGGMSGGKPITPPGSSYAGGFASGVARGPQGGSNVRPGPTGSPIPGSAGGTEQIGGADGRAPLPGETPNYMGYTAKPIKFQGINDDGSLRQNYQAKWNPETGKYDGITPQVNPATMQATGQGNGFNPANNPKYGPGGAGAAGGAGGSGGGGQSFGAAFETALYDSFNKPGWDPEPVINKGTEEIAEGERNSLTNLSNLAANQGIEGGAVQAGNREVLSDFAGKRANLARDTRAAAARDADQSRLTALSAAGNYLGRAQDNARSDRNAMMQLMMQNLNNRQSQATDFSSAMSAPRPTLTPLGGSGNAGKQKDQYATSYGTTTPQPTGGHVGRGGAGYTNRGGLSGGIR